MKIAVFGGIKDKTLFHQLFRENVKLSFFIDNNMELSGKTLDGIKIYSPYMFPQDIADFIVIFVYQYEAVRQQLVDLGVCSSKIINFYDDKLSLSEYGIFNEEAADRLRLEMKLDYLDKKIKALEDNQQYFERNFLYEAVDRIKIENIRLPKVNSVENTCKKIFSEKCSMSRYGDGEFEIILGSAKDIYQHDNVQLAKRLKDILMSNLPNHLVAVADDYGSMEGLRQENKNTIRRYMTEEKREQHYALLDMEKEYYNAYISRPYVIYPHDDIEKAKKRFGDLKRIWDKQNILFIEGDKTRMGVGNDLFNNAEKIERIIAPNENAFDAYDELCDAAMLYGKDKLILIALGPTATVLAYDLAKAGYWALDIGHLDLEYEWFLKGKGYSYIPNKYNNETFGDTNVTALSCPEYDDSILCRVGV